MRVEERPMPWLAEGEVLLEVLFSGVCQTDLSIYRGDYRIPLPRVLGHELCGKVAEVGPGVEEGYRGRLVVCEINDTCISHRDPFPCSFCVCGLTSHCSKRSVMGIFEWDGAFSQFLRAPVLNLRFLPEELSPQEGVFVEPLAAAVRTFELAGVKEGDVVAVLGVGRLGVLICKVACLAGARVIAISRSPTKLSRAEDYGAFQTIHADEENLTGRIQELTEGRGADVVVESTGNPQGIHLALELVRPQGTIALKSTPGLSSEVDLTRAVVNEVRLQGSRCGSFSKALTLLAEGHIDVKPLIDRVYPLWNLETVFQEAAEGNKVLLDHSVPF